jgi:GT2 family glycosyltransferase
MEPKPQVSIIIVNYNTRQLLADCLASVKAQTLGVSFEIIVVDNHSTDGSLEMLEAKFPSVRRIANPDNPGFGAANNQGVAISRAPFVLLLNSDTVLREDTASRLHSFMQTDPRAAAAGPLVLLMDGTRQPKTFGQLPSARVIFNQSFMLSQAFPRCRFFAGIFVEKPAARVSQVGWISGVCMLIRREAYVQVGGFDPAFFLYAEDLDLCRRFGEAGWRVYRIQDYALLHLCGGSSKSEAVVLRNGILQQRNFLKLVDASTGRPGRTFARAALAAGLLLRVLLRGLRYAGQRRRARVPLQVSLLCLADLLGRPTILAP